MASLQGRGNCVSGLAVVKATARHCDGQYCGESVVIKPCSDEIVLLWK